jgi:1-deoxy-D-xylulose-5-phosphate reductoisomerase
LTLPSFPRRVAILGSTGSIGKKAVAVAERHSNRIRVVSLSARQSVDELANQAGRLGVVRVALDDGSRLDELKALLPSGVTAEAGPEAVAALAGDEEVDLIVNGVVGRAGLEASLVALTSGKMLALANKESLVLAGELLMEAARDHGGILLPVDSEHSGLFQCLEGRNPDQIRRLIITASGGPFRGRSRRDLDGVTPAEALMHPVWPMGPRITVDSATLFNKGLEVIETHHLFGTPLDRIAIWVHPQSVIHALVELRDHSLVAQVSAPDMMMPVQYAMSYPERWDVEAPECRLPDWGTLEFEMPDVETFPALGLAYRAAEKGGTAPAVLNAADETAVEAFLAGRLPFLAITDVVEEVLETVAARPARSLGAVVDADREARETARGLLEARSH